MPVHLIFCWHINIKEKCSMQKVYYVTGNSGKVKSAQKYLNDIEVEMVDYDFNEPDINDIKYTAEWKVRMAYEMIKKPCIALDSGFYI